MEEPRRRKAAPYRRIAELREGEEWVKVMGLVVEKRDSEIVLDDGSGTLTVFPEKEGMFEGVEVGSKVRVFGRPTFPVERGGKEMEAEIVQRVDGLDFELYWEVMEEVKKLEEEVG
ncbi:MAG: OB-fold nucleic acid binding domain-containing protein [Candidatus Hadarchaeales archaeon]